MAHFSIKTLTLLLTVSFVLGCSGGGGESGDANSDNSTPPSSSVTTPAPTVNFSSSVEQVTINEPFVLSWSSSNASQCEAMGSWQGALDASGEAQVESATRGNQTYEIQCSGEGGSVTASVEVQVVNPPPTLSLSADVSQILAEQPITLTWSSQFADVCSANGDWQGEQSINGSATLSLSEPGIQTLTLVCQGESGEVSQSVEVDVLPIPTLSFEVDHQLLEPGQRYQLSWLATEVDTCQASGDWMGNPPNSGTYTIEEALKGNFVYTLTCQGTGGEITLSVQVEVTDEPALQFTTVNQVSHAGGEVLVQWQTQRASTCNASGDWAGEKAVTGEELVTVEAESLTLELTCSSAGGDATETLNIEVPEYQLDSYYGTQLPHSHESAPQEVEYFNSNVGMAGQLEGLGHEPTAENGAGKFVFNRVYRAFKHGIQNGQQFGIFGSWLQSYGNNSIEGGLWVSPKTAGPYYYPTLHLAAIGDTYYACNDVTMGGGLYERVLSDKWLTMLQVSNQVLSVPGVNIAFDMEQPDYKDDNGIWVGSGWTNLNLDHPRDFKYWISFVETQNYQGPVIGYVPEHFNWIDPEKVDEGSFALNKANLGSEFGTFATKGASPNYGNGNERINMDALRVNDDTFYVPVAQLPIEKEKEYLVAYPQSIEQTDMDVFSQQLKAGELTNALIPSQYKRFNSLYKSTHNQLKVLEEVGEAEYRYMVVPPYQIDYEGFTGFVSWDFSTDELKAQQQQNNGYLYVQKSDEKWQVEEGAGDDYRNHPHSYQTQVVDNPDGIERAPNVTHTFYNYKERDTTNPEFANWNVEDKTRYTTKLENGAVATYVWFKFIEQPAMKTAKQNHPEVYTDSYLETLQAHVEKLHAVVNQKSVSNANSPVFINYGGLSDDSEDNMHLAKIDQAQMVQPLVGQEVGYVPVVISVYHPSAVSANGLGKATEPDAVCSNEGWTDTFYPDID